MTTHWIDSKSGSFEEFKKLVEQKTCAEDWPMASSIEKQVLIYKGAKVRQIYEQGGDELLSLKSEWTAAFSSGPGVILIKNAVDDMQVIDKATKIFNDLIDEEKAQNAGGAKGDHFAKPGANDRVWNSLQKHCLKDPQNFAQYYGNQAIALACQAWLGDGYQMTAQVNRVNPGGNAQTAHRDFHLGFMSTERMALFPAHVHHLSPMLTLQGAIAHVDMPLESGPTLYLPYSQQFFEGYLAFGREEYQAYFDKHHVQMPLEKGDVALFNPALMHGVGSNVSKDLLRMGKLIQVSSAFGRAMETVDRQAMVKALYPVLSGLDLSSSKIECAIAASAEGYSFPTNLDNDPPVGGIAPKTQQQMVREALATNEDPAAFNERIDALAKRQRA